MAATFSLPCPACSSRDNLEHSNAALASCGRCGALFTTRPIPAGDSYALVAPRWATDPAADSRARYFDLDVLQGDGTVSRRHGWFDPETRLVTQVG